MILVPGPQKQCIQGDVLHIKVSLCNVPLYVYCLAQHRTRQQCHNVCMAPDMYCIVMIETAGYQHRYDYRYGGVASYQ
jgi:hypothetical protein